MNERKEFVRSKMIDILVGREPGFAGVDNQTALFKALAAVLSLHENRSTSESSLAAQTLQGEDWFHAMEIFWDLILERKITPGLNPSNPSLPFFRLHSEASF